MFTAKNTEENIKTAIEISHKVKASLKNLDALEAELGIEKATQSFSSDIQAVGGLFTEDRDTEMGANIP